MDEQRGHAGRALLQEQYEPPGSAQLAGAVDPIKADSSGVLRVGLLGGFEVRLGARAVPDSAWRWRRMLNIIKLLALEPRHNLPVEQVIETVWADHDLVAQRNNLSVCLHYGRKALLAAGAPEGVFLVRDGELLALGPAEAVWVDVSEFERAVARAWHSNDPLLFRAAVEAYHGDLLPEDAYADWLDHRRTALRTSYLTALARLGQLLAEQGATGQAIDAFQQLVAAEPTQEDGHVALMRLYAQVGQRAQALAQYDQLVALLARELDVEPERGTQELAEAIRSRAFPAATQPLVPDAPLPLPARPAPVLSMPAPVSALIGREREVAEVRRLLAAARLVTLTGPGGIGKTRIATAVAQTAQEAFADGVALVSLAATRDPDLVVPVVARTLGIGEQLNQPLRDVLRTYLQDKNLLLVLDNFEQIAEAAPLVGDLLAHAPHLKIIVTSRVRLHLSGEHEYLVPPLELPLEAPDTDAAVRDALAFPAVALFIERAQAVKADFALDDDTVASIVAICQRLSGLPLAIELAAARTHVLTVQQLLARLDRPLALLTGGPRDVPERQRTMRNAIQWSYDLLPAAQQTLLRRLSVFAGGWTLEMAEAIVDADGHLETSVLDGLAALVDASLVTQVGRPDGQVRFGMLEPIREFAFEQLLDRAEAGALRAAHATYIVALLESAVGAWFAGRLHASEQLRWLDRIDQEHNNFSAALSWALEHDPAGLGLRLVASLWPVWFTQARFSEGNRWARLMSDNAAGTRTPTYAMTCFAHGFFLERMGRNDEAERVLLASAALARELDALVPLGLSLDLLGNVARSRDRDFARAKDLYAEAGALFRAAGFDTGLALATANLGLIARLEGRLDDALQHSREALALSETRVPWVTALALSNLAEIALLSGDLDQARRLCRQALQLSLRLGMRLAVRDKLGQPPLEAEAFEQRSMEDGSHLGVAFDLFLLACIEARGGRAVRAAQLLAAVERRLEATSPGLDLVRTLSSTDPEQLVATLRAELSEQELAAALESGRNLDPGQLFALALQD